MCHFAVISYYSFFTFISKYVTLERKARQACSVINRRAYKHHVFAPTADTRSTIFPKLCTMIEHVETIK